METHFKPRALWSLIVTLLYDGPYEDTQICLLNGQERKLDSIRLTDFFKPNTCVHAATAKKFVRKLLFSPQNYLKKKLRQ